MTTDLFLYSLYQSSISPVNTQLHQNFHQRVAIDGLTENDGHENDGPSCRHEIAGHENDGPSCRA